MAKIPANYLEMRREHADLMTAYEALGEACRKAGPLDAKTAELVKLGVALTAGLEGGSHSHVRRALAAGCTEPEIRHVVLLLTPTIGFPAMMRARSWVEDVLSGAETP
jgi:alkylhydroperoxidase/carboxymuconolactone decarboxylase family protein YurZ